MSDDDDSSTVRAKLRVMPTDADVNLDDLEDAIEDEIEDDVSVGEIEREAVAFGLKALLVPIGVSDEEGGAEDVADTLRDLENVESVRVENVTRV